LYRIFQSTTETVVVMPALFPIAGIFPDLEIEFDDRSIE
jgi:hypothetical protein